MIATRVLSNGSSIHYTPVAAVSAGDVVPVGSLLGIAPVDIPANTTGSLELDGVFDVPAVNDDAFVFGEPLYWDAAEEEATAVAEDNAYLGIAVLPKAETATTARVLINRQGPAVVNEVT